MNIFEKAYCRIFQGCFWIAYPILPYREPVMIDKGFEGIPEILRTNNKKRPLIITDEGIYKLGLTEELENILKKENIEYELFHGVVANPTTDIVDKALELYRTFNADSLIGFGGGSSIDTAKAVGALVANPKKKLKNMKGILKVRKKIPLLIAIPTTAGTGTEATLASVVVDSNTRVKYAINDFPLIPRYAVLEAKVTLSLPQFITATTGMDALTHAVESFIGRSNHRKTKSDAKKAVKLIFENLVTCVNNPENIEARRAMLKASYYAGCAFTRSYVGYVHAVAHSLGGEYNIPHGLANAVILPYVLELYGKSVYKKLNELAVVAGLVEKGTEPEVGAKAFIDAIKDMNKIFGLPTKIKELKEEDIPKLSKIAAHEGNPLYPVPVLMNAKELENIYYSILDR